MPASAAGRGSFGNPAGGGRRWVELRIVFESAGLFHGEVINAGSRCLRGAGGIVPFHYNCCRVRCPQRIMQREQPASIMRSGEHTFELKSNSANVANAMKWL